VFLAENITPRMHVDLEDTKVSTNTMVYTAARKMLPTIGRRIELQTHGERPIIFSRDVIYKRDADP